LSLKKCGSLFQCCSVAVLGVGKEELLPTGGKQEETQTFAGNQNVSTDKGLVRHFSFICQDPKPAKWKKLGEFLIPNSIATRICIFELKVAFL
jgi:hypothetical protein